MAFTGEDFTYGMMWAIGSYQAMGAFVTLIETFVIPLIGGDAQYWSARMALFTLAVSGFVGVIVSIVATTVASPVAYLLGILLRRCRWELVHLIAFGLFGLVFGLTTMVVISFLFSGGDQLTSDGSTWVMSYAAPAAIAVPLGQYRAARRALRADAAAKATPSV